MGYEIINKIKHTEVALQSESLLVHYDFSKSTVLMFLYGIGTMPKNLTTIFMADSFFKVYCHPLSYLFDEAKEIQ